MLGMAFFKSLIKEHGKTYFEPIGKALAGRRASSKPNPLNPAHAWALRKALVPYAKWRIGQMFAGRRHAELPPACRRAWPSTPSSPPRRFSAAGSRSATAMRKHQLKLADRQCRMAELSQRLQDLVVILATSLWAAQQSSELVQDAADILCQDLTRKLTGKRPTDAYFRAVTKLGEAIAEGGFEAIAGIDAERDPDAVSTERRRRAGRPLSVAAAPRPGSRSPSTDQGTESPWPTHFSSKSSTDKIALVTFDLPDKKVNTLGQAVLTELAGLVGQLEKRTDLRGLLFRSGKPGQFIAGADLNELACPGVRHEGAGRRRRSASATSSSAGQPSCRSRRSP